MASLLDSSGRRLLKDGGQRIGAAGEACCCGFCPINIKLTLAGISAACTHTAAQECNPFGACVFADGTPTIDGEYVLAGGSTVAGVRSYSGSFTVSVPVRSFAISGGACSGGSGTPSTMTSGTFGVRINCTTGEIVEVVVLGTAGRFVNVTAIRFLQGDTAAQYYGNTNTFPTCAQAAAAHCVPLFELGTFKVENA